MKRFLLFAAAAAFTLCSLSSCREERNEACDTAFIDSLKLRELQLQEREMSLREREIALMEREHAMGINNTPIFSGEGGGSTSGGRAVSASGSGAYAGGPPQRPVRRGTTERIGYRKSRSAVAGQYPEGSERALEASDLADLTPWGRKVMLSEIYARHGYIFSDAALRKHFAAETWYKGTERSLSRIRLTPLEKKNIAFLNSH